VIVAFANASGQGLRSFIVEREFAGSQFADAAHLT